MIFNPLLQVAGGVDTGVERLGLGRPQEQLDDQTRRFREQVRSGGLLGSRGARRAQVHSGGLLAGHEQTQHTLWQQGHLMVLQGASGYDLAPETFIIPLPKSICA